MTTNILKPTWAKGGPNDLVHEIDKDTKAILVELKDDGEIHFYIDGERVDGHAYSPKYKAGIDFHKIMEFIQSTLDKAQATMFVGKDGKPIQ